MTLTPAERAKLWEVASNAIHVRNQPCIDALYAFVEQAIKEAVEEAIEARDVEITRLVQENTAQRNAIAIANVVIRDLRQELRDAEESDCVNCVTDASDALAERERCARIVEQIGGIGYVSSAQLAAEIRKEPGR